MFTKGQAKTPGSGRKPGSLNKRTVALQAAGQLRAPFEGDAYALAALLYKDQDQPLSVRMAAMHAALPYERPRLSNIEMTTRSLDSLSDEEFFRAWDRMEAFLEQHGQPQLPSPTDGTTGADDDRQDVAVKPNHDGDAAK